MADVLSQLCSHHAPIQSLHLLSRKQGEKGANAATAAAPLSAFHPGCAASRGILLFHASLRGCQGRGPGFTGCAIFDSAPRVQQMRARKDLESWALLGRLRIPGKNLTDTSLLAWPFALTGEASIRDLRKSLHYRACCVEPAISQVRGRLSAKQAENFRRRWPASHFSVGRWARGAVDL